jgi:hypothetical protein
MARRAFEYADDSALIAAAALTNAHLRYFVKKR